MLAPACFGVRNGFAASSAACVQSNPFPAASGNIVIDRGRIPAGARSSLRHGLDSPCMAVAARHVSSH
jgi:hypothetical protein